ncbi:MAG: DUF4876 domain-containing protein [Prevotella sp.]|nr:DUF4876 domain-containing protein [Prevotella sp.]
MKQILLLILLCVSFGTANAQSWRLVITTTDGKTTELNTSDVRDIQFVSQEEELPRLDDKNADQIIIKEVYNGGCPRDAGSDVFQFDKCIVLYNNCPQQAVVNNLCFGFATPYNAEANEDNRNAEGDLVYEAECFTPALNGIWYYPYSLVIEPYSQVVVNVQGAIDNTQTFSQSVNYANPDYYCMYDPESGYNNTSYYPTPSDVIPASHYLRAIKYGQGNAWPLSVMSPALFIFQPQGTTPMEYAMNANNLWYPPSKAQDAIHACLRVPNDWIIDAVEIFNAAKKEDSHKRLSAELDGGYVYLTNKLGHTLYRNVDEEWTLELPENQGKLIYGYSLGVDGSTDPTGIDAEASIRNGAHIVYLDTNNSSEDFHERQRCSLRNGN